MHPGVGRPPEHEEALMQHHQEQNRPKRDKAPPDNVPPDNEPKPAGGDARP